MDLSVRNSNGMKTTVAIVGAGEFGLQALHQLQTMAGFGKDLYFSGWIDDTCPKGSIINGYRVLGTIPELEQLYAAGKFSTVFIAIGYKHLEFKRRLVNRIKPHIPMFSIIAPSAIIDSSSILGNNVMIYPGAIVDKDVIIQDGCVLNLGVIIAHNSIIGECSFIAPSATVAGFCEIGGGCFIGTGAAIIDNIKISDNSKIGAGAVVIKDILNSGLYCGVPAHFIHS